MRIVVLGHKGLLGNAVHKFLDFAGFEVITFSERWPSVEFKNKLTETSSKYLVNCIGNIPQKGKPDDYESLNFELPKWLDENLSIRIIHPTTDCEFRGTTDLNSRYRIVDRRDAQDAYGRSKAKFSDLLEQKSHQTKLIRTSIIGLEETSSISLLNWFLSQENEINGFVNHYWNGVTTLEWCKQCIQLIIDWDNRPLLNQVGTSEIYSKYEMLVLFGKLFKKDITIYKKETEVVNKCLYPTIHAKDLPAQLAELKVFYEMFSKTKTALKS